MNSKMSNLVLNDTSQQSGNLQELYQLSNQLMAEAYSNGQSGDFALAERQYLQAGICLERALALETNEQMCAGVRERRELCSRYAEQVRKSRPHSAPSGSPNSAQLHPPKSNRSQSISSNSSRSAPKSPNRAGASKSSYYSEMRRGEALLRSATESEGSGRKHIALKSYKEAADYLCKVLKAKDLSGADKVSVRTKLEKCLNRAEFLSGIQPPSQPTERTAAPAESKQPEASRTRGAYSEAELQVISRSSYVDGRRYLPWISSDIGEQFDVGKPWKDPDGLLTLSPKQIPALGGWRRPSEIAENPTMIEQISPHSVTQTLITDCSFVSSLIIAAEYERNHHKQLITSIIFPQDRNGIPRINPCGKYMIKLHLNGVPRKILIDDRLPVDRHGGLLCSYSKIRNEFWVSLIEKAFLKVMGGYDFPGSTSCQDLFCLTGWIPERIGIKDKETFNRDRIFDRIGESLRVGDSLITVSTGAMNESEADSLGLVPSHAYALLRVAKVGDLRLVQLKNPWARKRWTGAYSSHDSQGWTKKLRNLLKYDPAQAQLKDDGRFWISYDDLLRYFDAIYMNWNPDVFKYQTKQHMQWLKEVGPTNDVKYLHENPQFKLYVEVPKTPKTVMLDTFKQAHPHIQGEGPEQARLPHSARLRRSEDVGFARLLPRRADAPRDVHQQPTVSGPLRGLPRKSFLHSRGVSIREASRYFLLRQRVQFGAVRAAARPEDLRANANAERRVDERAQWRVDEQGHVSAESAVRTQSGLHVLAGDVSVGTEGILCTYANDSHGRCEDIREIFY
eukprot:475152_1